MKSIHASAGWCNTRITIMWCAGCAVWYLSVPACNTCVYASHILTSADTIHVYIDINRALSKRSFHIKKRIYIAECTKNEYCMRSIYEDNLYCVLTNDNGQCVYLYHVGTISFRQASASRSANQSTNSNNNNSNVTSLLQFPQYIYIYCLYPEVPIEII